MSKNEYQIEFTELALAFAQSQAALEERVRGEIGEMLVEGDLTDLSDLLFHTVEMADGRLFYCQPLERAGQTVLLVDTASLEETGQEVNGDRVLLPVPDTDD